MRSELYHPIMHWRRHPFRKLAAKSMADATIHQEDVYARAFTHAYSAAVGPKEEGDLTANDVGGRLKLTDAMHANMMSGGRFIIQAGEALERLVEEKGGDLGGRKTIPADSFHVAFSGAVDYGRLHGADHRISGVYASMGEGSAMFLVTSTLVRGGDAPRRAWPHDEAPALFVSLDGTGTPEGAVFETVMDKGMTGRIGWPGRGERIAMTFADAAALDGRFGRIDLEGVARSAAHAVRNALGIASAMSRRDTTEREGMPDDVDQDLVEQTLGGDDRAVQAIRTMTEDVFLPVTYVDLASGHGQAARRTRDRRHAPAQSPSGPRREKRPMGGARQRRAS